MSIEEFSNLSKKISIGILLATSGLTEKTIKEGGELVYSKNGKVTRVQAKDLK